MDTTPTNKVGLDARAYAGKPKGFAHVWPDYVEHKPRPHWSWVKRNSRHKLSVEHTPEYLAKLQNLLETM